MILEKEAVKGLCEMDHETSEELQALKRIWLVPVEEYKQETKQLILYCLSIVDRNRDRALPVVICICTATKYSAFIFAYGSILPAAEKFWRLQSFSTVSRDQLGMYDTIYMLKRLCL